MKFYLIKNQKFTFTTDFQLNSDSVPCRELLLDADITPTGEKNKATTFDCCKLKELIQNERVPSGILNPQQLPENQEDPTLNWKLQVTLGIKIDGISNGMHNSVVKIGGKSSHSFLDRLAKTAQAFHYYVVAMVRFKKFGTFHTNGFEYRTESLHTEKAAISSNVENQYGFDFVGLYNSGYGALSNWANSSLHFTGSIDVVVWLKKTTLCSCRIPFHRSVHQMSTNEVILKNELASDVTIVSADGSSVKCHRSFLLAHSPVFDSMFKGGFEESETRTVQMSDMTRESVKAFLDYIYVNDITTAMIDSTVALELYQAGHKYGMSDLEGLMKNVLLAQPDNWFDVDVCVRMYLFSRNVPQGDNLKMRAVQLIKLNYAQLKTSESYQQLYKEEPATAMELFECVMSISQ